MKPRRSRKDAVAPVGGGEALPPRPARVVPTDADNDRAADEGNSAMERQGLPDFVGLWTADVVD